MCASAITYFYVHVFSCFRLAIILGTVFGCILFLVGLIILLICCTKDRCFQKVSPRKSQYSINKTWLKTMKKDTITHTKHVNATVAFVTSAFSEIKKNTRKSQYSINKALLNLCSQNDTCDGGIRNPSAFSEEKKLHVANDVVSFCHIFIFNKNLQFD